jgi:type II secretory pathway component PulM
MSIFAAAPALPLHTAGPYVAAAYIVFLVVVLIYVAIMATRLRRAERELTTLRAELDARDGAPRDERDLEPVA